MPGRGNINWSRAEHILAFNLYCKIPFGTIHMGNPRIIELARLIGRSIGSVSYKLSNFALRAVLVAANATRLERGVESGEVGELVGDGTDAAANQSSQFDDARIAHVNRAERNFAVEVEREDVFRTRPVYVSSARHGHASQLPPHAVGEEVNLRATGVAFAEVVQRSEGALRVGVV